MLALVHYRTYAFLAENMRFNTSETIILPVIFYGQFCIQRGRTYLRVTENKVWRNIFES
jgi:hypothetical protein